MPYVDKKCRTVNWFSIATMQYWLNSTNLTDLVATKNPGALKNYTPNLDIK